MRTRPLGRTGLVVPELGFGCSPLGGVFGPVDEGEAIAAVHLALERGITYFDTAPFYGLTRSETVLGRALAGVERSRYVLSTKVGRYGEREFDFSAGRVATSLDESLERLGVDSVDVAFCHDVEFGSIDVVVGETIPALEAERARGRVRAIGISGLPLARLERIVARAGVDVVLSYCHYNLYDTSLVASLPALAGRGAGIVLASPLAMGLLSAKGPPPWHPAPARLREACAGAVAAAEADGIDVARLALAFAVRAPGVATTLVGMSTRDEVERNVAAVEGALDPAAVDRLREELSEVRDATWPSGAGSVEGDLIYDLDLDPPCS